MIIPGSVIPKWFIHQSIGAEVNIKEPSSHLCDEWMGIAICVVFSSSQILSLSCELIARGKVMSASFGSDYEIVGLLDNIWLCYLHPQYYKEEDI